MVCIIRYITPQALKSRAQWGYVNGLAMYITLILHTHRIAGNMRGSSDVHRGLGCVMLGQEFQPPAHLVGWHWEIKK